VKLRIAGLGKRYTSDGRSDLAIAGCDLEVAAGEVVTIVGASGCGKTTLLNCVAGLIPYDEGSIEIDGEQVVGPGPDRAVVFQHASLVPWRTALRNVEFGMQLQRRLSKAQIAERSRDALALVGLTEFADYYPNRLSGGMSQRVNLARALATQPSVLLMDEPFGALDALTKVQMQQELGAIAAESGSTVLFITHDIDEAIFLGDRVVVMTGRPGRFAEILPVPFERPRRLQVRADPRFQRLHQQVWQLLGLPGLDGEQVKATDDALGTA
jgi:NitT/TauT family transport system ATP-binding protein